ncbi:MAG: hypothetical protein RXR03_06740 [Thermocladium sp.]|jgi:hypothetical protein|nr:MAG: hypothetical protein AT710_06230 [Thermocladium sp. ECH_B]
MPVSNDVIIGIISQQLNISIQIVNGIIVWSQYLGSDLIQRERGAMAPYMNMFTYMFNSYLKVLMTIIDSLTVLSTQYSRAGSPIISPSIIDSLNELRKLVNEAQSDFERHDINNSITKLKKALTHLQNINQLISSLH